MSFNIVSVNQRIAWIDNVKAIAIACVIFGHFNGLLFSHGRIGFDYINLLIVVFNMPLFVMMSGYCNYHSLKRIEDTSSLLVYLKKTFLYIAVPCIIPCVLVYIIEGCHGMVSFTHYWFLVMLFVMQVACGFSFYISSKLHLEKRELVAWGIFSLSMFVFRKYATSELFIYYLMGGLLKMQEHKKTAVFSVFKNNFIILFACCVALCLFSIVGKYQFYNDTIFSLYHDAKIYIWFLRVIDASLFCYIIIALTKNSSSKYNFLSLLGSKTLGLYIYTGLIIDICLRFKIKIIDDSIISWLYALIISLVATVVSFVLVMLLESNKYSRFLFFGKK